MNGLVVICIWFLMALAGLETGSPGIISQAVTVAAKVYADPHLPQELAAVVAAREAKGGQQK